MHLTIIRHGEPDITGDLSDPPLTELGQRQASLTARFLSDTSFDAVYVSPQRRAQETMQPMLEGRDVAPVTDERIAEFDYEIGRYVTHHDFEGLTPDERNEKFARLQGPDFHQRVRAGFTDIIDQHRSQSVLVVCHGGVISSLILDVLKGEVGVTAMHASVTRVAASSRGVRSLISFNEHHWLRDL